MQRFSVERLLSIFDIFIKYQMRLFSVFEIRSEN